MNYRFQSIELKMSVCSLLWHHTTPSQTPSNDTLLIMAVYL